jgi:hypothetical protein
MTGRRSSRVPTAAQGLLLREILEKRAPDLASSLLTKAAEDQLDRQERLLLCELIGAEFAETGVDADFEPLPRGSKLEELLDVINRPNQGRE